MDIKQSMKTVIGIIIVIIVIGGGWYYFAGSEKNQDGAMMEKDGEAMMDDHMDDGAMMEGDAMEGDSMMEGGDHMMMDGEVKVFTIEGSNFKFLPNSMTVKKGDTVRVVFKNTGGFHDFVIDEFNVATKQINGGSEETVEFVADKAGSFEYYCSVGSHRQMGMVGTLTVQE